MEEIEVTSTPDKPVAEVGQAKSGLAFNPIGQFSTLDLIQLPIVSITDNNFHQIAPANPQRLALYVVAFGAAVIQSVAPEDLSGTLYNRNVNDILPVVIHAAQYPVLCQGPWYVQVNGNGGVLVYESIQRGI